MLVDGARCLRITSAGRISDDGGEVNDPVAPMVSELLSRDPDATVLSEADVRWEHLSLVLFERQCVRIRGVLGRPIRTITIPDAAGAHRHHHDEQ